MRRPDAERQKDAEEARTRKGTVRAAFDASVKRLHAAGATDVNMGRVLRVDVKTVKRSRERQGLEKNCGG